MKLFSSLKRNRFRDREQAKVAVVRRKLRAQDREHHRQHRHGLQRNGPRLPPAGSPGPQNGPELHSHVQREHPDVAARATSCRCHAGVHTVRRCPSLRRFASDLRHGTVAQPQRRVDSVAVPMRPVWSVLRVESHRHGQERRQWKDFLGEALQRGPRTRRRRAHRDPHP